MHAQHVEIMQLQIHPLHQNKGYGKAVIEQLLQVHSQNPLNSQCLKTTQH
ncbi:GNAT family N-acetyltransferase [Pseudoalteromonas sp. FUC4]